MLISKENFKQDLIAELKECYGTELRDAPKLNIYLAIGDIVRKYTMENWIKTSKRYNSSKEKQIYYFSMEFLLGKLLESNLINLDILDICKESLKELGIDFNEINEIETDQGLGNGGLGRLAACFLDSMASLNIAGHGSGIRYKYGFFQQRIIDGYQVEAPDNWLRTGEVWEIKKPDKAVEIRFGGYIKENWDSGKLKIIHEGYDSVLAVPYDTPIVGYKNKTVNTLRLWSAESMHKDFDFALFSRGEYVKAVEEKYNAESISQILYPSNEFEQGKQLRLKQQYFLVSAGIQSIIRTYKKRKLDIYRLDEYISIQINDTHPTLVIPELMRILMDEEGLSWEDSWRITTNTVGYTNHTILPEALEKWNIIMFKELLPRIYIIIEEINERFCKGLWDKYRGDWNKISRMAIIADGYIKMAHLAIAGSKSVNGVAKIHTEILKNQVMSDFYHDTPYKFNNKTNGVTHRRWMLISNPALSRLITDAIGPGWIRNPMELANLNQYINDYSFLDKLGEIKRNNKLELINKIKATQNIDINPDSIFDIHVKRIHAYKRQVLNVMNIINLYNRLKENPNLDITPRTFIFAGKAAPSYRLAKQIIKLINCLADLVNNDKTIQDKIKVIFMEDYKVSSAEIIIPAADVSQQISTTTKEASGTGNMKFMMNGAITLATLDGANVEIKDAVGSDNIVIFGLTENEVVHYYLHGGYNSIEEYKKDHRIMEIINQISNWSDEEGLDQFDEIINSLLEQNDEYFILKDFDSYVSAQDRVDMLYKDKYGWLQKSLRNIAASGTFSSDRTILEYAKDIWNCR